MLKEYQVTLEKFDGTNFLKQIRYCKAKSKRLAWNYIKKTYPDYTIMKLIEFP